MKKIAKLLVVTALLTALFAMPVMAREVSFSSENTDYLITLLNNNATKLQNELAAFAKTQAGPNAQAIIAAQTALVNGKIAAVNKECAENHIQCLTKKAYDAQQTEARRLSELNYMKTLHGSLQTPEVVNAQKQYDLAIADTAAKNAYLAEAKVKLAPYM